MAITEIRSCPRAENILPAIPSRPFIFSPTTVMIDTCDITLMRSMR